MRRVRIATAAFPVRDHRHTRAHNLSVARRFIRDAVEARADILCLPEAVLTINSPDAERWRGVREDSAPVRALCGDAAGTGIAVVAPFLVREGGCTYNQCTVIDGRGAIAGRYRKVQLNGAELPHLTPGETLPVIDLPFGRIAVLLCMDIYFPEIARIYAMKGAELLFWPTITHGPTQEALEIQARCRALDNSLPVIEANLATDPPYAPYAGRSAPGTARIIDHNGDIIAQTGRRPGLAVADIDLDAPRLTSQCVLLREPDHMREDLASLFRADLYAREYAALAENPRRFGTSAEERT